MRPHRGRMRAVRFNLLSTCESFGFTLFSRLQHFIIDTTTRPLHSVPRTLNPTPHVFTMFNCISRTQYLELRTWGTPRLYNDVQIWYSPETWYLKLMLHYDIGKITGEIQQDGYPILFVFSSSCYDFKIYWILFQTYFLHINIIAYIFHKYYCYMIYMNINHLWFIMCKLIFINIFIKFFTIQ